MYGGYPVVRSSLNLLLCAGVIPNVVNDQGRIPLHLGFMYNTKHMAKALTTHYKDHYTATYQDFIICADNQGDAALHMCVEGSYSIEDMSQGADQTLKKKAGRTVHCT